jgi:hypothetical protein
MVEVFISELVPFFCCIIIEDFEIAFELIATRDITNRLIAPLGKETIQVLVGFGCFGWGDINFGKKNFSVIGYGESKYIIFVGDIVLRKSSSNDFYIVKSEYFFVSEELYLNGWNISLNERNEISKGLREE